jgi:cysteine desulfurase
MRKIYLDHNATTPVHPEVLKEMEEALELIYGNPSTLYTLGREAKVKLEEARDRVANLIGAKKEEIVFTSGGTEANNLVIFGIVKAYRKEGNHIITSKIEHDSVLNAYKALERDGFDITYLPVDSYGMVNPDDLNKAIRSDTILISIMHSNNETGTIQPIEEMAKIARNKGIPFHTDAVQSIGKIKVNVEDLGVNLLSMASHKIYGPKGIGALYIKKGTRLQPILYGGHQEKGYRPGTENIPGIVGFGKATELAFRDTDAERLKGLRDRLYNSLNESIGLIRLNGHPTERLPNTLNISIEFVEGEGMVLALDDLGIFAGTGSACATATLEASHVLAAMGVPAQLAHCALRFSLGRGTKDEDIDYVIEVFPGIVEKLRGFSPLYKEYLRKRLVS